MQPKDSNTPAHPEADTRALDGKALARAKRERMRRRTGRIRRTIAASAATLFAAAFLGVYVQLASGHDPALLAASKRTSTSVLSAKSGTGGESTSSSSSSSGETESGTSEEGSSSAGEPEEGSSSAGESEESSPSPVTTSQS